MRFDQVLVGARDGDAITQIVLNLQTVLAGFGPSEIFALHVDPSVHGRVQSVFGLPERTHERDVVIFHVSIGDSTVTDIVSKVPGRVWIFYHNISPASMYQHAPEFAAMLELGREQFSALAPVAERVFVSSEYNRLDAASVGVPNAERVPAMIDPYRLNSLPSDPHFGRQAHERCRGPLVLSVGQLLPHKRPELLVAAHHLLTAHHIPDATLVLAGHHPSPDFAAKLQGFIDKLGLSNRVWVTGGLADSQLAELYRQADALATASRHEGLCVPVIEAMALSVPVVASAHGALPETVGDAGLVVEHDAAEYYAEAINIALTEGHRVEYALRGRRRARELSLEQSCRDMSAIVDGWLGA